MEVSSQMMEHKIDIFGLAKTNTHWNNGNIYRKALNSIKKTMKNTKAHIYTSDSTIEWKSRYKPGGTAIITNGQITNQVEQIENDSPLGRWTSITIGPPTFEITIITAYIVCHTQITPNNDKTAAHQQWKISSLSGKRITQSRKTAIKDLITHVKKTSTKRSRDNNNGRLQQISQQKRRHSSKTKSSMPTQPNKI